MKQLVWFVEYDNRISDIYVFYGVYSSEKKAKERLEKVKERYFDGKPDKELERHLKAFSVKMDTPYYYYGEETTDD